MSTRDEQLNHKSRLRRVLNIMFPAAYIELHHLPPHSPCSVFAMKPRTFASNHIDDYGDEDCDGDVELEKFMSDNKLERTSEPRASAIQHLFRASTEPSSRTRVIQLREQFDSSLLEHQAKPIGLCPIRRAIYDQCFDEIIRQVTVGCIEQGLLLLRIRNEIRMTLNYCTKIYESGVRFGINKMIEAELKCQEFEPNQIGQLQICRNIDTVTEQSLDLKDPGKVADKGSNVGQMNEFESLNRMKEYYKDEIVKKEQVITEQRNIIQALTRKYTQTLESPL